MRTSSFALGIMIAMFVTHYVSDIPLEDMVLPEAILLSGFLIGKYYK